MLNWFAGDQHPLRARGTGSLRYPVAYGDQDSDHHEITYFYQNGVEGWLVTRYDHIRTLLADNRLSIDRGGAMPPSLAIGRKPVMMPRSLVSMDPPEHTKWRRLILRDLTVQDGVARRRPGTSGDVQTGVPGQAPEDPVRLQPKPRALLDAHDVGVGGAQDPHDRGPVVAQVTQVPGEDPHPAASTSP